MGGVFRFGSIAALVVLLDQVSKYWIARQFSLYETLPVLPGFFNLTYLTNTGAAFGLLAGQPAFWRHLFFVAIAVTALVIITVLYFRLRQESFFYELGLGLIAGGALGNLVDRVRLGSVVDFLDFYIGSYHWPAFNVADSAITVGVSVFLVYSFFFDGRREERQAGKQQSAG